MPGQLVVTRRFPPALMERLAAAGAWVNHVDEPLTAGEILAIAGAEAADVLVVTATDRISRCRGCRARAGTGSP